jgi:hypothetical protein
MIDRGNELFPAGVSFFPSDQIPRLTPADRTNKASGETTFVLEREFAERAFLFIGYAACGLYFLPLLLRHRAEMEWPRLEQGADP